MIWDLLIALVQGRSDAAGKKDKGAGHKPQVEHPQEVAAAIMGMTNQMR